MGEKVGSRLALFALAHLAAVEEQQDSNLVQNVNGRRFSLCGGKASCISLVFIRATKTSFPRPSSVAAYPP